MWKDNKDFFFDVLRNTQLARLFFPTWDVRIYIPRNLPDNCTLSIPANVQTKLEFLGAKIYYVDMNNTTIPLQMIDSLVVHDKDVSNFIATKSV